MVAQRSKLRALSGQVRDARSQYAAEDRAAGETFNRVGGRHIDVVDPWTARDARRQAKRVEVVDSGAAYEARKAGWDMKQPSWDTQPFFEGALVMYQPWRSSPPELAVVTSEVRGRGVQVMIDGRFIWADVAKLRPLD